MPNIIVYGFDSFEGLPEDFENGYTKGKFRLNELPIVRSNVKLVVGLLQESLEPFLNEHIEKVAFMHIDADLYSSTKYVLFKIAEHNRLQKGTVIQFDEFFYHSGWWAGGEYKAFVEFVKEFNVEFQYIGYFAPFQGAVAIEILKV